MKMGVMATINQAIDADTAELLVTEFGHKIRRVSESDVEIALAASGGAFGAKEELSIQAQTAMAAYLLGRPVKTTLTREQSTQHHVKRHPMTIKLKGTVEPYFKDENKA